MKKMRVDEESLEKTRRSGKRMKSEVNYACGRSKKKKGKGKKKKK